MLTKRSIKSIFLVFMVSFVYLKSFAQLVPGPSEPHEDPPSAPSQPAPYEPPPAPEPQPAPYEPPPPVYQPPSPEPPPYYPTPDPTPYPSPYPTPDPAPPQNPPVPTLPPAPTPDVVHVTQAFDMVVKDNVIEMQNWRLLADADRGLALLAVTGEFIQNDDKKVVMKLVVDGEVVAKQVFNKGTALPIAKLNLIPSKKLIIGNNISTMKIKIEGAVTIKFFQTRIH